MTPPDCPSRAGHGPKPVLRRELLAKRQISASKRSQKEATAASIYGEYLRLAIDNPEESRRDKQNDKIRVDDPKYDAFVTYALYAAEEILNLFPDDSEWRNALKLDLSHHKDFFNSDAYKNDANSYTTELQGIVGEICSGNEKREEMQ